MYMAIELHSWCTIYRARNWPSGKVDLTLYSVKQKVTSVAVIYICKMDFSSCAEKAALI